MRHWALAGAAIALALTASSRNAAAIPAATPAESGLAAAPNRALHEAVLVCDAWTCYWRPGVWGWYRPHPNPYWGWRRHYWWGWRGHWHGPWRRW